jgi:hypothetical protein
MPFTYQDYLRTVNPQGNMEDLGGLLNQGQWDALNPTDQLYSMGGMLSLNPGDSRYNDFAATTKPELGRAINIVPGQGLDSYQGVNIFNDPSRVQQGDGWHAYSADNQTAQSQDQNDSGIGGGDDKYNWLKGLAFVGGGAAAANGLMGAGAAADAAPGAFDFSLMNPVTSPEIAQVGADFVPGSAAGGGSGGLLGGGADTGGGFGLGDGGGIDPETWAGNGGMGVSQNGIGPGSWQNIVQGSINNPGSLVGRAGNAASSLGSWALKNPLQAYGAVQTLGGMLGGRGSNGGGSSASGKPAGNGTGMPKLDRPQFIQNPYLAAQLRQGGY